MDIRTEIQKEFLAHVGKVIAGEIAATDLQSHVLAVGVKRLSLGVVSTAVLYNSARVKFLRKYPQHRDALRTPFFPIDVTSSSCYIKDTAIQQQQEMANA